MNESKKKLYNCELHCEHCVAVTIQQECTYKETLTQKMAIAKSRYFFIIQFSSYSN